MTRGYCHCRQCHLWLGRTWKLVSASICEHCASWQVCLAYRGEEAGSRCAVVLCQREKLQMEAEFRRVIPHERRFGTKFVFRQGQPLIPDDLRQVAASQASATIVISDSSRCSPPAHSPSRADEAFKQAAEKGRRLVAIVNERKQFNNSNHNPNPQILKILSTCRSPEEADAQAVRIAVLLDELDFPGFGKPDPRTGHIVVEVKTPGAADLVKFSCSNRVIALPTGVLNATR